VRPTPSWELSRRGYWQAVGACLALFLGGWLLLFRDVYGLCQDDAWTFLKAVEVAGDWKTAFAGSHYGYPAGNVNHLLYLLVTKIPLATGWTFPSFEEHFHFAETARYRFTMLFAVLFQGAGLALWAWVAETFAPRRREVALLSLVLILLTPTYNYWLPKLDSRLLGLPFALCGLGILIKPVRTLEWAFVAGLLLSAACSIHYTAAYLVMPVALAFSIASVLANRRQGFYLSAALALGIGAVPLAFEAISYAMFDQKWDQGPFATARGLSRFHTSKLSRWGQLRLWVDLLQSQVGLAAMVAFLAGLVLAARKAVPGVLPVTQTRRMMLLASVVGFGWLLLWGGEAFIRQTSYLQPFVFFFAGVTIVAVAARIADPSRRRVAMGLMFALIAARPAIETAHVLVGHAGLGRTLRWVHDNRPASRVYWLASSWAQDPNIHNLADLDSAPEGAVLIGYYPSIFLTGRPGQRVYLEATPPLFEAPSLWSASALSAEGRGFGHNPFDSDLLVRTVRVWSVASLREARAWPELPILRVTADSSASPDDAPESVFDHDSRPGRGWVSADTPGMHTLEVVFQRPTMLGDVFVVERQDDLDRGDPRIEFTCRIVKASIDVAAADGVYKTVWLGDGLERDAAVRARWPPTVIQKLKIAIDKSVVSSGPTNQASIEELAFPGHTAVMATKTKTE